MNFFNLNLAPRLLLASLPIFVEPWLYRHWEQLFPSAKFSIGFLWYLWTPPFHDVLFGLLVLVPFIAVPNARAIRVFVLVAATVAIYTCAVSAVVNTQGALNPWLERDDLRFISVVPIAMMATWLLAAATAWIAPLRVSRRYWIYTGLAGLATGLGFLISQYSDPDGPPAVWWLVLNPFFVWPVSTCVAIYYGRRSGSPAEA